MCGFLRFLFFIVVLSAVSGYSQVSEDSYNRAYVYAQKGFYEDAISEYRLALKATTNKEMSTRIYYNMGLMYIKLKDLDNAEKQFEAAYKINSNLFLVCYNLADVCYDNQKFAKSADYFRKAIDIDPKIRNIYDVYSKIGVSLYHLDKYNEAIKYLKKALSLKADYPLALECLSRSYIEIGSLVDAEKCLNRLESLGYPQKDGFMELRKAKE